MFWSFQRCVWATASTDRAWISAVSATRVGTAPDATCVGASKTVMATAGVRTALATASAASTVTTAHSVSLQRKRIPNQNERSPSTPAVVSCRRLSQQLPRTRQLPAVQGRLALQLHGRMEGRGVRRCHGERLQQRRRRRRRCIARSESCLVNELSLRASLKVKTNARNSSVKNESAHN